MGIQGRDKGSMFAQTLPMSIKQPRSISHYSLRWHTKSLRRRGKIDICNVFPLWLALLLVTLNSLDKSLCYEPGRIGHCIMTRWICGGAWHTKFQSKPMAMGRFCYISASPLVITTVGKCKCIHYRFLRKQCFLEPWLTSVLLYSCTEERSHQKSLTISLAPSAHHFACISISYHHGWKM